MRLEVDHELHETYLTGDWDTGQCGQYMSIWNTLRELNMAMHTPPWSSMMSPYLRWVWGFPSHRQAADLLEAVDRQKRQLAVVFRILREHVWSQRFATSSVRTCKTKTTDGSESFDMKHMFNHPASTFTGFLGGILRYRYLDHDWPASTQTITRQMNTPYISIHPIYEWHTLW